MIGDRGVKGDVGLPGSVTLSTGDPLQGPPGLPGLRGPQVTIDLNGHYVDLCHWWRSVEFLRG